MVPRLLACGGAAALLALSLVAGGETNGSQNDLRQRLLEDKRGRSGLERRLGPVYEGHLEHRESVDYEVRLEASRCYRVVAVGGRGVVDLSLLLLKGGREVTADRTSGEKPRVAWCSASSTTVTVRLEMYGGGGAYAMAVFEQAVAPTRRAEKVGGPRDDFIANRVRQMHRRFGRDRGAICGLLRGNLASGDAQTFKLDLKEGHCYTAIGAGDPTVEDLDLVLIGPDGRELAQDGSGHAMPVAETTPCLEKNGRYELRVIMRSGSGQFGVQVFSD